MAPQRTSCTCNAHVHVQGLWQDTLLAVRIDIQCQQGLLCNKNDAQTTCNGSNFRAHTCGCHFLAAQVPGQRTRAERPAVVPSACMHKGRIMQWSIGPNMHAEGVRWHMHGLITAAIWQCKRQLSRHSPLLVFLFVKADVKTGERGKIRQVPKQAVLPHYAGWHGQKHNDRVHFPARWIHVGLVRIQYVW